MNYVRVAGVQVLCDKNKQGMLDKVEAYIAQAVQRHGSLDIVCLPELFYQSPFVHFEGEEFGEEPGGACEKTLCDLAKKYRVNLVAGSYAVKGGSKVKNRCLVIDRQGQIVGSYDKLHLFDSYGAKESDAIDAGDHIGLFDLDIGRIGVVICYDIRFPELTRALTLQGAQMIFAPAAFFQPRHDHWETMLKAMAIHDVLPVVAVNQVGNVAGTNMGFFGRSMAIDASGVILGGASDREGYFFADIDLDYTNDVRKVNTCLENRRPEFYK